MRFTYEDAIHTFVVSVDNPQLGNMENLSLADHNLL